MKDKKIGNSIFKFERDAGIDSPFGDWRSRIRDKQEEIKNKEGRKKQKKCIIEFEPDDTDNIKNGVFGFDKYIDKFDKFCLSGSDKLKKEYNPITVNNKEYLPPWISIRKGQSIVLKISKLIIKETLSVYKNIEFQKHPDFKIIPIDKKDNPTILRSAKRVKITCKNTKQKTTQIKVMADGKEAGALNFWYPKPKTIDLKWYFVEITGGEKDKKKLVRIINKPKLENLLIKGLNPALIDITLLNSTAEIIDISEYREILKKEGTLIKHSNTNIGKYIERKRIQRIFGTIGIKHTKNTSIINLYSINRKCLHTKDINTDGTYKMIGGLSPTNTGLAYMTLEEGDKIQAENIIHEIMHALGLEHTFSTKATHTFKETKTKNYMDYDNVKRLTWKWQWVNLNEYSHLK